MCTRFIEPVSTFENSNSVDGHIRDGARDLASDAYFPLHSASTVHSLPAEILILIFHSAFTTPFRVAPETIGAQGPWALAHVCQRWRALALSEASLWSSFYFSNIPEQLWRPFLPGLRAAINTILSHSRNAPLDFIFPSRQDVSEVLLYDLLKQSSRWKSVKMLGMSDELKPLMKVARDSRVANKSAFERLEVLQFKMENFLDLEIMEAFDTASRLRSLTLNGYCGQIMNDFVGSVDFPWSQLTHLSISTDFSILAYRLLASCVNLETFREISHMFTWFSADAHYPIITHDKLRSLHVTNHRLLLSLECPNITHITCCEESVSEVATFVRRCCAYPGAIPPESVEVWIRRPHTGGHAARSFLSPFSWAVRKLTLDVKRPWGITDLLDVCLAMTYPEILPQVSHLALRLHFRQRVEQLLSEENVNGVGAMLQSFTVRQRLKTVTIEVLYCDEDAMLTPKPPSEIIQCFFSRLAERKPAGLNLEFMMALDTSGLGE